jgi:hypothetical protein
MTWLSNLWNRLPDKMRQYLPHLAIWFVMTLLGWWIHKLTGIQFADFLVPIHLFHSLQTGSNPRVQVHRRFARDGI